jgi:hypothetical protein
MTKIRSYFQGVTPLIYELSSQGMDVRVHISLLTFSQGYDCCSYTSCSLHLVHSVSYFPARLQCATRTPSTVTEQLSVRWSYTHTLYVTASVACHALSSHLTDLLWLWALYPFLLFQTLLLSLSVSFENITEESFSFLTFENAANTWLHE